MVFGVKVVLFDTGSVHCHETGKDNGDIKFTKIIYYARIASKEIFLSVTKWIFLQIFQAQEHLNSACKVSAHEQCLHLNSVIRHQYITPAMLSSSGKLLLRIIYASITLKYPEFQFRRKFLLNMSFVYLSLPDVVLSSSQKRELAFVYVTFAAYGILERCTGHIFLSDFSGC